MRDVDTIRHLIGKADPARETGRNAAPQASAAELVARAETAPNTTPATKRSRKFLPRFGLLAATLSAALVGGSTLALSESPPPPMGPIRQPIELGITDNPPPAGDVLRAMARDLEPAPYEREHGRYQYIRTRSSGSGACSAEGQCLHYTQRTERWIGPNGQGLVRTTPLPVEFPDKAAKEYFRRTDWWYWHRDAAERPTSPTSDLFRCLRRHSAEAARCGLGSDGPFYALTKVGNMYSRHLMPREMRAKLLRTLAGVEAVKYRGKATSRTGKPGIAISAASRPPRDPDLPTSPNHLVLVFDPKTGVLLSSDQVWSNTGELVRYTVYEEYGRTNNKG